MQPTSSHTARPQRHPSPLPCPPPTGPGLQPPHEGRPHTSALATERPPAAPACLPACLHHRWPHLQLLHLLLQVLQQRRHVRLLCMVRYCPQTQAGTLAHWHTSSCIMICMQPDRLHTAPTAKHNTCGSSAPAQARTAQRHTQASKPDAGYRPHTPPPAVSFSASGPSPAAVSLEARACCRNTRQSQAACRERQLGGAGIALEKNEAVGDGQWLHQAETRPPSRCCS